MTLFSVALFLAISSFLALALTIRCHLLRLLPADPEFREKEIYDKIQGGTEINLHGLRGRFLAGSSLRMMRRKVSPNEQLRAYLDIVPRL